MKDKEIQTLEEIEASHDPVEQGTRVSEKFLSLSE